MTTEPEFEGRDLREALAAAAAATGVDEADLHYSILEQGRRGVFGLGARSVRIRVLLEQFESEQGRTLIAGPTLPPAVPILGEATDRAETLADRTREIRDTVARMLELMGMDLDLDVVPHAGGAEVRLHGPDRKLLTQSEGDLLSALQFLVNRMGRRAWPEVGRIQIVIAGERGGRDGELIALIREVAEQVGRTGRARRLQPMNAYERRLVHITVREFPGLGSRSDGDGHLKRVTIFRQGDN